MMNRLSNSLCCTRNNDAVDPSAFNWNPQPEPLRSEEASRFPLPFRRNARGEELLSPFSRREPVDKIQTLLDSAYSLGRRPNTGLFGEPTIKIGNRNLTVNECLTFALEIALETQRERVPEIATSIVHGVDADISRFSIFGVDFTRQRLEEWSREQSIPESIPVRPELAEADKGLKNDDRENVHSDEALIAGGMQLDEMRKRLTDTTKKSIAQTGEEIRHLINNKRPRESSEIRARTLAGLDRIMKSQTEEGPYGEEPNEATDFGETLASTLAIVWGYIEQVSDDDMKENLRESMGARLREIEPDFPCNTGVSQRLCDIPTAIDWSLTQGISLESLRSELAQMAGSINETFEADHEDTCTDVRAQAAQGQISDDPDKIIGALKRDMFYEKARIEYILLRNISPNTVIKEAKAIFPEDFIP